MLRASLGCFAFMPLLFSCAPRTLPGPAASDVETRSQSGEPEARRERPSVVDAHAEPLRIEFSTEPVFVAPALLNFKRGINLGNGYDAPTLGAWGVTPDARHFKMAADVGFDHMRLPVKFSAHAQTEPPYTIDEAFFAQIDWAIEQALSHGLGIIIDLHHYDEIMHAPDAHEDRLVAMWRQIAERYKAQPPSVVFELLNEPNENLNPAKLNPLVARLIDEVRVSNPTRTIIVDSFFWAAAVQLRNLELPEDDHLVASFHMYQPILFTHQGAEWMDPEFQTRGIIFPGPPEVPATASAGAERTGWTSQWLAAYNSQPAATNPSSPQAVSREFDYATQFSRVHGIPVYLGELGAIDHADPISRENYLRLVRREAERRGFAWAIWDDGGRNRAMDIATGQWVAPVARALFTDQPGEPLPTSIVPSR